MQPERLEKKLLAIRDGLGLSQIQMLAKLGLEDSMHYGRISQYENDEREPTLMTLLSYAHVAGVHYDNVAATPAHIDFFTPTLWDVAAIHARKNTEQLGDADDQKSVASAVGVLTCPPPSATP